MAKTIGFFAMLFTISGVTTLPTLKSNKHIGIFHRFCQALSLAFALANCIFNSSRSVLPLCNTPFLIKHDKIFMLCAQDYI